MRLRGRSIVRLAALLAVVAATGAPVATVAADVDPEVLSVASLDPHTIKNGSNPAPLATLHLPPGRWVAWAVVRYGIHEPVNSSNVSCWTKIVQGTELDRHRVGDSGYGTYSEGPVPYRNLAMSVAANVTSGRGATVSVRCRGRFGVAREARIIAMRAGSLTRIDPYESHTWGSGSPRVRQLRQTGAVALAVTDTPATIASMDLGAGRWWIRAHLSLRGADDGGAPPDSFTDVTCRLQLGGDADRSDSVVDNLGADDDQAVLTLEVAANIATPATARLRCASGGGGTTVSAREIRITAVRADRLTLGSAAEEATHTTTGKGKPWIIHLHRSTWSPIAATGDWVTIGRSPLTAGKWLVTAKYAYSWTVSSAEGYLECRIRLDDGTNLTRAFTKATGAGVPLQLVGRIGKHGGDAWLECRQLDPDTSTDTVQQVRMTAVRVR